MKATTLVILAGTTLVIGVVNAAIFSTESRIRTGCTIYLEHAPVDPRSLMQGDYMILNYKLNRNHELRGALANQPPRGTLVLEIDDQLVATFVRFDDGRSDLAENEVRLRYRRGRRGVTTVPESFFFQEGHASHFEAARFSKLKVSDDGVALLTGLADKHLSLIDPSESAKESEVESQ